MHASTLNVFEIERQGREVRSLMNDAPYGDPFAGTPYGQYNKSKGLGMVLGVVASVVTMGAAAPMLGSEFLATQIAGGAMMAGGVLSGVGAITGNKKLSKIGGVLSLAGGIGGAASNMTGGLGMGSGSTAVQNMAGKMMESVNSLGINIYNPEAANAAANAGSTAGEAVANATQPAAGQIDLAQVASTETAPGAQLSSGTGETGILNRTINTTTLGGVDAASAPGTINIAEAPSYGAGVNPWSPSTLAESGPEVGLGSGIADPNALNAGTPQFSPSTALESGPEVGLGSGIKDPNALNAASSGGFFGSIGDGIKNNPELTKMATGAIGEFAKAGMSPDESAQIAALSDKYAAEANVIRSNNELLQYQNANRKKQVALISVNDPNLDAKVKEATAKGNAVAFLPNIGADGVEQIPNTAWGQGIGNAAQNPTRKAPVYGQPAQATA